MTNLPTDLQILVAIYERHSSEYPGPKHGAKHQNDPILPLDLAAIAGKLGITEHLLFGRLYALEQKHGIKTADNTRYSLFAPVFGDRKHGINFPMMTGMLANMDHDHRRTLWSFRLSVFAAFLATLALVSKFWGP